ncbi:hypothetical protein BC829DRAFT_425078 [Chytridium lagenaria]|nr:hypothetical protein BC829DRAFT_425078 [Chytridium lagenaria]
MTVDLDLDGAAETTAGKAILVANRGEIAIRVMRAGFELGMKTISIYSHEDRLSMHRYKADESFQIGAQGQYSPVQAYLAIDEIGVSCIHPGYGFLSENPQFARQVEAAGIAFVGPPPSVIDACGDKTRARSLAIAAGVPVVPGSDGPVQTVKEAVAFVQAHGLPVIIKAANGGGGRGMRVSESLAAFGDDTMFIEKLVEKPRHIEVQLLADHYGNVVHLFERDCSVQRRHQKVVEMGPANLPDNVRQKILGDAIKLATKVGYRNAGTAEFLVDQHNNHYFIEINPRIQVEHCVTEEITGIDIVSAQIQIALGASLASLGLDQSTITLRGTAIQCRITAEDPSLQFRPDTGRIEQYRTPGGPGVRLDGGPAYTGAIITPHYDSLLVKCICTGHDFQAARRKMLRALAEFRVRGVKNNVSWLIKLLHHPVVAKGEEAIWTTFIDDTAELFEGFERDRNRGQRMLRWLGDVAINGPRIVGQSGVPALDAVVPVPKGVAGFLSADDAEVPCKTGWRKVLLDEGPEAFAKAVRKHPTVLITDTTWRDAHQSLLATRVRTLDMSRIAPLTSHVLKNAFSIECWGGATFDVSLRFLHECPWDRLATLRALMLLRGANGVGYTAYPDNVVKAFVRKARECGVDVFRVFDSLNYGENLAIGVEAVREAGGVCEGAVSYTGDVGDEKRERYGVDYYLDVVDMLVKAGIHVLGIKDMAGLLKPKAASILVRAIRSRHPDLVIHLHTHDTAGTGVATYLAAVEAGADVVDVAVDSMSGTTSQPSMGAFLASVGADEGMIQGARALSTYWAQTRLVYSGFEAGLLSCDASVYDHEMPGGQYTNLQFQARQLGLGDSWEAIKIAYAQANRLCGDITKVVGDLAQFMVAQKLTEQDVLERAETLSFPSSVVEYLQGLLGMPPYGFLEPFRSRVLNARGLKAVEGRPGKDMPALNLDELKASLEENAAMYPKVFDEYYEHRLIYGDLSKLPTQYLLRPFESWRRTGKTLIVQLQAVGPVNEANGRRDVYFVLNGEARVVDVEDRAFKSSAKGAVASRPKASTNVKGEVGAPMSGTIVEVRAKEGATVKAGDPIVIMSAMKMETVVTAPIAGVVKVAAVKEGDSLTAGDLIAKIE